ncbi:hypothetical protein [Sphingosinicella rhizophila]|uniref:DUF962 domain-containing protein n=1 Tax=Sphingosinicella rhizophila TaxID=3050082 RepID=A0ABU3Q7C4_9SPHN|nr:hypothetical protein [Sphingosinicella sp. GR2756]MDT9599304.1 hypothetical protein [Sphingosinicella sp. GR2756]
MSSFRELLAEQRWDDHRYYHHSLVNQSLHFVSACTFVSAYVIAFKDVAVASLLAWCVAMLSRQAGHFFFEPKGYDEINQATHEYKEEVKLGYNLARKWVFMTLWALSPLFLFFNPTLFGLFEMHHGFVEFVRHVGLMWLMLGIGGLVFRTIQLFFIHDVRTGLVWATKIVTDPFNDIKLYHRAPLRLIRQRRGMDVGLVHEAH